MTQETTTAQSQTTAQSLTEHRQTCGRTVCALCYAVAAHRKGKPLRRVAGVDRSVDPVSRPDATDAL